MLLIDPVSLLGTGVKVVLLLLLLLLLGERV
jgi:hypothetical protein